MKIIRAKDYYDMSRKAANIISAQVIMKPNCVLGLATGGTPVGTYKQLVEWYNKGDLDFAEVNTVNLDEYRGLPREHPESYWSFMHRNLFDLVNIRPEAIHMPAGTNMDAAAECSHYDEIIQHLLDFGNQTFVIFLITHLDHRFNILVILRQTIVVIHSILEIFQLLHSFLGFFRIIPKSGFFHRIIQLVNSGLLCS